MLSDQRPSAGMKRQRLRDVLRSGRLVLMPGVWDSWSALLVEAAGFEVALVSGQAVSASVLGVPDMGYLTLPEMVACSRRIAQAVDVPVVADIDAGYGNALVVIRSMQELEQAGVAGLQIEDQQSPANMWGRPVVPRDEMVRKIQAAIAHRRDPDFVIIARTDAVVSRGLAEALERVTAYDQAGADALMVTGVSDPGELAQVARSVAKPVVLVQIEGGVTPMLRPDEALAMGFTVVTHALSPMLAASRQIIEVLHEIRTKGHTLDIQDQLTSVADLNKVLRLERHRSLEDRFAK